ncbi:MAG: NAD(+)/NADH kinase [Candidatus Bathyarchaeota archaeon]|nr:MAG: NAD(+)/NADH kinase [Candidatus Bathyarchaeota archaeon]
MKAGLVSRIDKPEALELMRGVLEHLESRGVEVLVETETAFATSMPGRNSDLGEMEVDFVVTVGGDGTILRTAMQMREPGTPILGVNMGSRGFLTEVLPEDVYDALDKVLEKDHRIEECMKLSSRNTTLDKDFPDALNEVLVASSLPSKALDFQLSIDDQQILDIQADGIIVATPVGSTAYNLSAGGSILSPDLGALIITAICPYSYFRSIVVPQESRVGIELLKPNADALVIIDGRDYTATKPLSRIEVWASRHRARFIRFRSFYERLERRLVIKEIR